MLNHQKNQCLIADFRWTPSCKEALGKKTKERVDSFLPSTVYLKMLASSSMPGMPSCKVNSRAYLGLIVGIIKVSKMDDAPRGTETAAAEGGGEARGWEERVEREVECDGGRR